jgi:hypothetical protein
MLFVPQCGTRTPPLGNVWSCCCDLESRGPGRARYIARYIALCIALCIAWGTARCPAPYTLRPAR